MKTRVVTYHLEMTDPKQIVPPRSDGAGLELEQVVTPSPQINREMYARVGRDWRWVDRRDWSDANWLAYLDRPEQQTWLAVAGGERVGYFELEAQAGSTVEIVYFGLLPGFVGRGLGGALLVASIRRAWDMGPRRVWVHTCSLDHPGALANYKARGFRQFKEEISYV